MVKFKIAKNEKGKTLNLNGEPIHILPVGTILSFDRVDVDPIELFGGDWTYFGSGRVLVGYQEGDSDFGTILKEGGEKQHTLTTAEMPSHSHNYQYCYDTRGGGNMGSNNANPWFNYRTEATTSTGGGNAHNNLQPYIVVYRWLRVR